MRYLLIILAALSLIIPPTDARAGEASLSEQINQAAIDFDEQQAQAFKNVADSLDRWRKVKYRKAANELADLFTKAVAGDKAFIAYHLLGVDPKHKAARQHFVAAGEPAPIDEQGKPVPGVKPPTTTNRTLAEKVATLRYPPFSEVAEVISPKAPTVQGYWKRQRAGLEKLREQLLSFANKGERAAAFQVFAYYWPDHKDVVGYYSSTGKPVPRQRTWFPNVDRYLLDNGLAGIDCLDTRVRPSSGAGAQGGDKGKGATLDGASTWDFTEFIRNCRVEGLFTAKTSTSFTITDASGKGAVLVLGGGKALLQSIEGGKATTLAEADLGADLATAPVPVQFEVHGRSLAALVGGVEVCAAELTGDIAYKRVTLRAGGVTAQLLRVRYLGEKPDSAEDLLGDVAKAPIAKPAEESWLAERKKQLDKAISFKFDDTSVEEVVALLAQLGGVKIGFDSKAETLKNLPVTLAGKDMKLTSALDWLQRVTDISWQPTADGVQLTWNK